MKAIELLEGLSYVKSEYLISAERFRNGEMRRHSMPRKKVLLLAAAIAAALLLVGCAVAVVASLQNRKMGETTREKYFDSQGNRITPTEVTVDIINLYGTKDTPQFKAMQEWEAWNEAYSPDLSQISCENAQGVPENLYYSYNCYTLEMADKLMEILDKYGLKPLDTGFGIDDQTVEDFFDAYSIDGICHADSGAKVEALSGWGYTCGAMELNGYITPVGGRKIFVNVEYTPKDYFAPSGSIALETEEFEEWGYTTADGSPVQMALGSTRAFIFREQSSANIFVILYGSADAPLVREELEQVADILNFQISPVPPADPEGFKAQMREAFDRHLAQKEEEMDKAAEAWEEAHSFDNYADYLKGSYSDSVPEGFYALWDIQGDGVEELLIGNDQGVFYQVESIENGEVVEYGIPGDPFRVCEGGILAMDQGHGFSHSYVYGIPHPQSYRVLDQVDYRLDEDQWYDNKASEWEETPITQAEADAIRAKYTPIEIPVFPLKDYPVDDQGTTLESYITQNLTPTTEEDALKIYREFLENPGGPLEPYTYYRLQDLDGDGIPELFVGRDAELFNGVYKVVNGKLQSFPISDSQFCEGGIYRRLQRVDYADGYEIRKVEDGKIVLVDYIRYEAEPDLWGRSADGDYIIDEILTPEEAQAILDSYKIIPSGMKPVSEFPAKWAG